MSVRVSERYQYVVILARTSDKDGFSFRSLTVLEQVVVAKRSHGVIEKESVCGGFRGPGRGFRTMNGSQASR